jgi:hypothetical protein
MSSLAADEPGIHFITDFPSLGIDTSSSARGSLLGALVEASDG